MDIEYLDLELGLLFFGCGHSVPITHYIDIEGEDCEAVDAVVCVAGPLPGDGGYLTFELPEEMEIVYH